MQEQLTALLAENEHHGPTNMATWLENLERGISKFVCDPEDKVTFAAWYKRYQDIFSAVCAQLDGVARTRLLLRKLHTAV